MPSLKTIKRKLHARSPYREALHELATLQAALDKLSPQNGDTILFKLDDHSRMTNEMIRVFLDVASQRGLRDINAFLLKQGDSVETISSKAFDQIAQMKGYVREGDHAIDQEREPGGYLSEHSDGEGSRETSETSGSDCSGDSQGQQKAEGLRAEESQIDPLVVAEQIAELELPAY